MGFLDRAIRRGISEGVGKAVGGAIEKAVAPKAEQLANQTAQQLDQAAQTTAQQTTQAGGGLNGAFANLQRAAEGYATEISKNMKICPSCGEPAGADKKFCPKCGGKMPEQTVAQGAVCPSCGKQNSVGTKFCQDCGTKLPSAVAEEQAAQANDNETMQQWDELLPAYPKWNCGGTDLKIEHDDGEVYFSALFQSNAAAKNAIYQYRDILMQNGFHQAGEHPCVEHLYKVVNGVCYHVNTGMCFEADACYPTIYFNIKEPNGGFNYAKTEPKKATGFKDLFGLR